MPLGFITQNNRFIFADHDSRQIMNPESMRPGTKVDVYIVLQNTDFTDHVDVQVWVECFDTRKASCSERTELTQPKAVTVPKQVFGIPGQATIRFSIVVPTSGQGHLTARLEKENQVIEQFVAVQEIRATPRHMSCFAL